MIKWQPYNIQSISDNLPQENTVTIYLNNKLLATIMATPSHIKGLVVGFLYSENIIDSPGEIDDISINQDKRKVQVWVKSNVKESIMGNRIMTSGCGRGLTFICPSDLEGVKPISSDIRVKPEEIINLTKKMLAASSAYHQSGGIHSCAVCNPDEIISLNEDIGRHNAVDKIIGDCLLRNINLTDKIILSTGRISSEMLLKAFRSNIPIVCSLTSPTSLAVELASKLGITVVGYIKANSMKIYTHPARILWDTSASDITKLAGVHEIVRC
ncbi:MAG: formate dehydrogenase accessory sulfurtransferase FdhD [Planctomycetes bacterium]|nr:formate dehydrogenase accessory sulfurtransferase FdhD [Planctomycetota bacterium]